MIKVVKKELDVEESLKGELEFWKNKFNKLINFIKDRLFQKKIEIKMILNYKMVKLMIYMLK